MTEEVAQLVKDRFKELPEKLQGALLKPSLRTSIGVVSDKHHLPSDKASALENEVVLTLLALEPLEQFDERIMAELLIPGSLAASITRDLSGLIFSEVEPELRQLSEAQEDAGNEEPKELSDINSATRVPTPVQQVVQRASAPPLTDMPRYVKDDPYREPPK